jgi:hypothetical protein
MEGMSTTSRVHREIYEEFMKSPTQNIAYSTIISSVLRGELHWVKGDTKQAEATAEWVYFVRNFVLMLCLYGYAVIRCGHGHTPVVAHGLDVEITYNRDKDKWEPRAVNSLLRGTSKWHLLIMEPPSVGLQTKNVELNTDLVQYVSCGVFCLHKCVYFCVCI